MPDPVADRGGQRTSPWGLGRLSAMMALQYWSLGVWWVTVPTFIAENTGLAGERLFSSGFAGYSLSSSSIGALAAPVLFGWIADRWFSPERVLAVLHVGAAASLWWMHSAGSQVAFFVAMLLYFQMLAPTVTLTNTIALGRLADRDGEFPIVRMFGTVGWVVGGVFVGVVWPWLLGVNSVEASRLPIALAAWSHAAMVLYSLTLQPTKATPASRSSQGSGRLWGNRAALSFLGISLLMAVAIRNYDLANLFLNRSGYQGAAATLTLGQMSEVACLGAMGLLMRRFPLKNLFLLGIACWVIRYGLLALGSPSGPDPATPSLWAAVSVVTAILVHGPAYAFVFLAGQVYIDRLVPESSRGVGQGLHTVATGGIGSLLGAGVVGVCQQAFLTPAGVTPPPYHWAPFWLVPLGPCLIAGLLFWALFAEQPIEERDDSSREPPA